MSRVLSSPILGALVRHNDKLMATFHVELELFPNMVELFLSLVFPVFASAGY